MKLSAILPVLLLCAGCQLGGSPFVGKWETVINPNEQVPLYLRAAVGTEMPVLRMNMELRADKTFSLKLPVVGDMSGTWEQKENGRLGLKVTAGPDDKIRTSLEGLELIPSDENKKLTLAAPTGLGLPVTFLFTRADGK